jgi:7,8-dihydropterin-6-yl-methyl-4-(beta-D-ribofuranosyl)aminobenzene 5'-phosphate synthase
MLDEQCLIIKTNKGLVILSGDSHAGLSNTLFRVGELFDDEICAFIGGVHLTKSTNRKIEEIAADIEQHFSHVKFYLNHTSVVRAIGHFRRRLGDSTIKNFFLGSEITFGY